MLLHTILEDCHHPPKSPGSVLSADIGILYRIIKIVHIWAFLLLSFNKIYPEIIHSIILKVEEMCGGEKKEFRVKKKKQTRYKNYVGFYVKATGR